MSPFQSQFHPHPLSRLRPLPLLLIPPYHPGLKTALIPKILNDDCFSMTSLSSRKSDDERPLSPDSDKVSFFFVYFLDFDVFDLTEIHSNFVSEPNKVRPPLETTFQM